jgi:hypothetical protein
METSPLAVDAALRSLIDDYRTRCLWFMRRDYYPDTPEAQLRVLDHIQRHGDRDAFVRAATLRQWLSPRSSTASARS